MSPASELLLLRAAVVLLEETCRQSTLISDIGSQVQHLQTKADHARNYDALTGGPTANRCLPCTSENPTDRLPGHHHAAHCPLYRPEPVSP